MIERYLPDDEYQAAINANNPSASNPFLTQNDVASIGDMTKAVYDTQNNGRVDTAEKLALEVINKTGALVPKGTIVYLKTSSASGTHPEIELANNTTEATSSKTIGAVYEDIANDAVGLVITSGEVDNIDTSGYTIGTRLWLGSTPGSVTTTKPSAPNHAVFIGIVTRSQLTNGRILYSVYNGYELDELHDVSIPTPPNNGDVLTYNSVTGLWEAQASSSSSGRFGIADSNGQYTYYTTLTLALAAAVPGQTVEFFTDYVETGAVSINLVNGVNINMNGHTYTCTYNAAAHDMFYAQNITCQFQNGVIVIDSGASVNLVRGIVASLGASIDATGLTIKVVSSGGKGRPLVMGTTACTVRNITCFSIDDPAIDADASATLYNCYGESVSNTGIILGNVSVTASNSRGFNCVGRSTSGYGIIVGVAAEATECIGRSGTSYGMYVFGGVVVGGYALSNTTGLYATTVDQVTDRLFRVRGVEITGGVSNPAAILVYDGTSTVFGVMESCSVLAGNNSDGIQLNTNGVFQNKLIVTNSSIRVVTAARNCLVGTAASTYCNYAHNIFAGATTPVNANVLQGIVNTPDLQGNILI